MFETKKLMITGVNGAIGQIFKNGLTEYEIVGLDLPDGDVRDYKTVANRAIGCLAIIHLAWDTKTDNFKSENINPDNSQMFLNVYKTALELQVPRVIMASSVHADEFYNWQGPGLMSAYNLPKPDSPYGAHKVFMESLGKYYSTKGLEVVCIRFGGLGPLDKPNKDHLQEKAAFLSSKDSLALIRAVLTAEKVPGNFTIIYGVSNNLNKVQDTANPFNWYPQDSAEDYL